MKMEKVASLRNSFQESFASLLLSALRRQSSMAPSTFTMVLQRNSRKPQAVVSTSTRASDPQFQPNPPTRADDLIYR